MKRGTLNKILILAAITTSVIALVIYTTWNMPHQNVSEAKAIEISAVALYDSLAHHTSNKPSTLINSVVSVTGMVKQISRNHQGKQVILLRTGREDAAVNCTMENEFKSVRNGEMLTLKGMCMGYSGGDALMDLPGDVFMTRCVHSQKSAK